MTMRFVYMGPPDEPETVGASHGLTGEWVKGEPRDIEDASHVAFLGRHPHWAALEGEAFVDAPEDADEAPPAAPRRGRPPKVRE